MKKNIFTILFYILTIYLVYNQEQTTINNSDVIGFFFSVEDFKNNTLKCSFDAKQEDMKIKLRQFFISPEISCIKQDEETIFYKDSIFAIKLSNNECFRFIDHTPYLIADTSFLYIYTHKTTKTEYIKSGSSRRAKEIPITYYYFSYGTHKNVFPLNIVNLCKYLNIDSETKVVITEKFKNNETLYSISDETGLFELNEFMLEKYKNNKQ